MGQVRINEYEKVTWKIPSIKIWEYKYNKIRDIYVQLLGQVTASTNHNDTYALVTSTSSPNSRNYYLKSNNNLQYLGKLHVKMTSYKKG